MPVKDYDRKMERELEKLEESGLSEENKELLKKFDRNLHLNDYSKARRTKLLNKLRIIAENNSIDYENATKGDIEDIILWLKDREDISETTKLDYKIVLKRFYRWVGDGEYPECVEWIKTTDKNSNNKLPEDMLTEEDVLDLIECANNHRDKAFISVLWETGARIGELIDLTVGALKDHKRGFQIVVKGKTGARRLLLIESVPYLREYLQKHPHGERKNAPLWVNVGTTNQGEKSSYRALTKALEKTGERAGIEKPLNPHQFRHSRATYLATKFTEAQMCQWFGWKQGSRMPGKYIHMSGRDLDRDYARLHGIEDEEPDHSKLSPESCPRCNEQVPPEAKFCYRCGQALSIETVKQIESDQDEFRKEFADLTSKEPELMEDMKEILDMMELIKKDENLMKQLKKLTDKEEKNQGL